MFKLFFLIISISFLLLSCNYKQLGCVVCKTKKRIEIKKYSNNNIKELKSVRYKSMRAVDVPVRTITKICRYDSLGNQIERTKINKIGSSWIREPIYLKRVSQIDSLNGEFCIIEKILKKDGSTIKNSRRIKKKNVA